MNATLAPPRLKSGRNLPPGPRGWPFFGNIPLPGADWLAGFERAAQQFGDVVYFQFLHVPMIMLVHPDAIESVLLTDPLNFTKSRDYRAFAKVLGKGLLTSEGEEWRAQRRMLQPAFRREKILAYAPVMSECAARMLDRWRDGETCDLHQEMMALTVEIVAKALFGADVSSSVDRIGSALETAMKQFTRIAGWAFLLPETFPVPGTRRMRRARRQLDEIIFAIIRERRASHKNPVSRSLVANGAGNSRDLLGALLELRDERGQPLSEAALRDQLMTIFLAGHETTAIALSWTWYLLATNPGAERKLHAELDEVLRGRAPVAADLPCLPYTEMVIKESMRLYPPAWGIGRQALHEFEVGGYTLPARTNIFMLQWVTQRDARFFPDPKKFIPERWREEVAGTAGLHRPAPPPSAVAGDALVGARLASPAASPVGADFFHRPASEPPSVGLGFSSNRPPTEPSPGHPERGEGSRSGADATLAVVTNMASDYVANHAAQNQRRPRFAYFPFGGGPRVCIGAGLAMMEATLLLATIAQRFRFTLVPDHPIKLFPSVTLRPKYGIKAVLHQR